MHERDRDALERAMLKASKDPARAKHLMAKLENEPWKHAAQFAAYCCQKHALHLSPWQLPPCVLNENGVRDEDEPRRALLRRMLGAGLSRYEPDPIAALAMAGAKLGSVAIGQV